MSIRGRGLLAIVLGAAGCAMTEPVMYSPHGNFLVFGYGADRSESIQDAEDSAQHHCRAQGKMVRLQSEVTVYQGALTEETHEAARVAERVAQIYGQPDVSQVAGVTSSSKDYKTTIEFQCQ